MKRLEKLNFLKYLGVLNKEYIRYTGKITRIVGLTIESKGPKVKMGELCIIHSQNHQETVYAEVVGFKEHIILLMPFGSLEGIGPGSIVESTGQTLQVKVGEELLGRILDGLGNPMDDQGMILSKNMYPVQNDPPEPLSRKRIAEPLSLGIKAIDGLLTLGKGQRVGIFAGSGVGKSTLLGMIARNTAADINIIGLIGERGREVREFLERDLGTEGLKRSVVVVATSDQPALVRMKAALTTTAIAEYFRDQGKDVMIMMDSLTRFSMAQREIGLAIGEPPVSRGYTPSVFSVMPKLLERAGNSNAGSITGLYTVLVDGDDMNEPVADTARGILDGHIVLSRKLAHQNHYPSIDVLQSVSRVMKDIVEPVHNEAAGKIKSILATHREAEDLINIGAYVEGSNPRIDYAIQKIQDVMQFLQQEVHENIELKNSLHSMVSIVDQE